MLNTKWIATAMVALTLSLAGTSPALGQDDGKVRKDLETVLALKGKPCGAIVDLRRQGENDYLVTCRDGSRYRIFISEGDQVVVEERD
ncbi:MAG: hypothetical protein HKN58_00790 [Xanthomonadales bacterium]|nr:hypothetical protein [Xanthomonadales bacterium]